MTCLPKCRNLNLQTVFCFVLFVFVDVVVVVAVVAVVVVVRVGKRDLRLNCYTKGYCFILFCLVWFYFVFRFPFYDWYTLVQENVWQDLNSFLKNISEYVSVK